MPLPSPALTLTESVALHFLEQSLTREAEGFGGMSPVAEATLDQVSTQDLSLLTLRCEDQAAEDAQILAALKRDMSVREET